jgi:peptidyl-prolyl cis-trans isomerase A (cyclophilin A)
MQNRSTSRRLNQIESLEDRRLMAGPKVVSLIADNRGEVQINLDQSVQGVARGSAQIITAGPDNRFNTADDVNTNASVSYNDSARRINIKGNLPANRSYRIFLNSTRITNSANERLDGEFRGTFPTGNNVAGGSLNVQSNADTRSTPTVRMSTVLGTVELRLRRDIAPNTAANFLSYANSGRYDNTIFHRAATDFVIQGGALQVTGSGTTSADVVATERDPGIADERNANSLRNVLGTMSFAKSSAPNSATNQFFINLGDNASPPARLDDQGFTPFAEVTSGLSVIEAINQRPVADLQSQIGVVGSSTGALPDEVPVNNAQQALSGLNPNRDLMIIRRIAVRNRLARY